MNKPDGNIHTMPDDGLHIESKDCFCSPLLVYKNEETNAEQWLHNDTRKEALN